MYADDDGDTLFVDGKSASEDAFEDLWAAYESFVERTTEAADRGIDAPISDYLDMNGHQTGVCRSRAYHRSDETLERNAVIWFACIVEYGQSLLRIKKRPAAHDSHGVVGGGASADARA